MALGVRAKVLVVFLGGGSGGLGGPEGLAPVQPEAGECAGGGQRLEVGGGMARAAGAVCHVAIWAAGLAFLHDPDIRPQLFTLADLVAAGAFGAPVAAVLAAVVAARRAYLVSGGTGSGEGHPAGDGAVAGTAR